MTKIDNIKLCKNVNTFEECELAILRSSVDKIEERFSKEFINDETTSKIIKIVEEFIIEEKCICYGGTAINNILPLDKQFYDKNVEFPDYDMFTSKPLKLAKKLADKYYQAGFREIEAKSGVHHGTYKVFVNFIPVADITFMEEQIYKKLLDESIVINNIHYAPPNFLRMAMYLELSRPKGVVSRWEKVLKRLSLLNSEYPLKGTMCDINKIHQTNSKTDIVIPDILRENLYFTLIDLLSQLQCVFLGSFSSQIMKNHNKKQKRLLRIPDFDVIMNNLDTNLPLLKEKLKENGFKKIKTIKYDAIGELIPEYYDLIIDGISVCYIYKPIACHNYNKYIFKGKKINIASIDTMLSFYLAFLLIDRKGFEHDRIICLSEFLFNIQMKNRLKQNGILRRYSMNCIGKQETLEHIRKLRNEKYEELKNKKNSIEFQEWFLRYIPGKETKTKKNKENKTTTKKNKTTINKKMKTLKRKKLKTPNKK